MSLIKLRAIEREELLQLHKREYGRKFADRIKTILLLDDGYTYAQISKVLFLDDQTIRNYEKYYLEAGLDRLLTFDYKGGFSKLSAIQD